MPAPTLKSFAARIYTDLAPLALHDVDNQYALAQYVGAHGEMYQVVEDLARDQVLSGGVIAPGWSQAVDINRAPNSALAWLAQFVGGTTLVGLGDADQRNYIKNVGGWSRGTTASLQNAVTAYLTGAKTVIFVERNGQADVVYDFESGTQSWVLQNGATLTQDALNFRGGGAHSLKVVTTTAANSGANAPNNTFTANTKVGFHFSFKGTAGASYRCIIWDATHTVAIASTTLVGTGDWAEIAISGMAGGAGGNATIILDNGATAVASTFYVDDVHYQNDGPYTLTVITRNSETPVADWGALQYIQNSGAETNTTGWTVTTNTITRDTGKAHSGAASFKATRVAAGPTTYADYAVTLPAGGVWTLSTWVWVPTGYAGTDVTLNMANFTGATDVDATHAAANMSLRDQWQQIWRVVTIAGTDLIGDLILTSTGAATGDNFWFDDVQFEDNPGPSAYIATNGALGSRAAGGGAVGASLAAQKPAGIILNYLVTDGLTYLELRAIKASYTAVVSGYATYTVLRGY